LITDAQTNKFYYKAESNLWIDTMFNSISTRTFINDSVFIDSGLLCASDTAKVCSITFKKIGINWYVNADGEWQEFYSTTDSLIKVVYFRKEKFILKPIGHSFQYVKTNLIGFIKEELYSYSSEVNIFWFDPNYGVVIIEGNGDRRYVRQDFAKLNNK